MKLHLFYFKDTNDNRKLEPILYAYTNNKEYAERFMEFRDMKKFYHTTRDISKNQYKDFSHQYTNQQLTKTKFKTKTNDVTTKISYIEIVCTWDEEKNSIISSDETIFTLCKNKMFDPSLLTMELKSDLYKLGFFTIYQQLYNQMYIYEPLVGPEYSGVFNSDGVFGDMNHTSLVSIEADQLEMFMMLYGGTIKKK